MSVAQTIDAAGQWLGSACGLTWDPVRRELTRREGARLVTVGLESSTASSTTGLVLVSPSVRLDDDDFDAWRAARGLVAGPLLSGLLAHVSAAWASVDCSTTPRSAPGVGVLSELPAFLSATVLPALTAAELPPTLLGLVDGNTVEWAAVRDTGDGSALARLSLERQLGTGETWADRLAPVRAGWDATRRPEPHEPSLLGWVLREQSLFDPAELTPPRAGLLSRVFGRRR